MKDVTFRFGDKVIKRQVEFISPGDTVEIAGFTDEQGNVNTYVVTNIHHFVQQPFHEITVELALPSATVKGDAV